MASDTGDSRRKHRRAPDEGEEAKSSKRHKHRHHHRHHHRRHSTKSEEESKIDAQEAAPPVINQHPAVPNGAQPDDDVEEGEILDEEGFDGCDVDSRRDKEYVARDGSSKQNLGDPVEDHLGGGKIDHSSSQLVEERAKRKHSNLKTMKEDWNDYDLANNSTLKKVVTLQGHLSAKPIDESISGGSHHDLVCGDMSHKPRKIDNSHRMISDSSSQGTGRGKRYYNANNVEIEENRMPSWRNSLSPNRLGDKHKPSLSPDGCQDEVHAATSSRSRECARERSHSHSVLDLDSSYLARKDKTEYDSDERRMTRHSKDRLSDSRDLVVDAEREDNTSCSINIGGDRLQGRDRWEKDRSRENESDRDCKRDTDKDGDRRRAGEQQRSKDRDHGRERELERSRCKDQEREREHERSRDNQDHGRERERERSRDNRRERERERSRDKGRERERERSRDMERKWDYERNRGKDMEVDRDRRRDWKDKDGERENKRDGDRDRDIIRDQKWKGESENERDRRTNTIQDDYVNRDRHRLSRLSRHDESEYPRGRNRKSDSEKVHSSKSDLLEEGEEKQKRDEDEYEDYEETIPLQLAELEEEDLNRIKEESRRRRQAILEKYKSQQSQQNTEPQSEDPEKEKASTEHPSQPVARGSGIPENLDESSSGVDTSGANPAFSVGKSPSQNGISALERNISAGGLGDGSPKSERSTDMFCDDIFGESPAGVRKSGKGDILQIERGGFHDNWDDADGYYNQKFSSLQVTAVPMTISPPQVLYGYRFGEILDGRYEVTAAHGKGVFSTVVRARDLKAGNNEPEEVAIKIIRNNDTMYKAGIEELGILKKLVGADPDDRRRCVRFLSSLKYRNHLCLVFESLHMNLHEVLKKFGRNIGLKLTAVRAYSKQLFIALEHLKNCGFLHCDIKPDNMLVNEAKNVLKLCDFGNAMYAGKNEITPYLVSRFYRAPEIILGLPYDHPLGIWSVGCCLFEIYTGKVLFPGHTNNDMLRLHMELKGPFPKKMLRKGGFIDQHFDQDLNFLASEEDPVTKKIIRRTLCNIKPKDIGSIISGSSGEDPKMLANFKDLLEKIFMLDPEKRMTVSQALNHQFITGK